MLVWEQVQIDRSEHGRKAALQSPGSVQAGQERPQVLEQRFPGSPWVKTVLSQAVPLWSVEVQGEGDTHLETPMPKVGVQRSLGPYRRPVLEDAPGRTCGA